MASSAGSSTLDSVYGLANAAVDRGHEVVVFLEAEGVRLIEASKAKEHLAALISRNVRLLACRTSASECGIESEEQLVEGAKMSSLSELVELTERSDRTVFLG